MMSPVPLTILNLQGMEAMFVHVTMRTKVFNILCKIFPIYFFLTQMSNEHTDIHKQIAAIMMEGMGVSFVDIKRATMEVMFFSEMYLQSLYSHVFHQAKQYAQIPSKKMRQQSSLQWNNRPIAPPSPTHSAQTPNQESIGIKSQPTRQPPRKDQQTDHQSTSERSRTLRSHQHSQHPADIGVRKKAEQSTKSTATVDPSQDDDQYYSRSHSSTDPPRRQARPNATRSA